MSSHQAIFKVQARAIPLKGNDIDTDRIIPARFLKCVVFDELGPHAFEDDRMADKKAGKVHPFDNPAYQGAGILVVEKNFGCGSSREHAPQALMRSGIRAVVGVSFAEIFFGNCVSLGIPCVAVSAQKISELQQEITNHPEKEWTLDLQSLSLSAPESDFQVDLAPGIQKQFLSGDWNPLADLLSAEKEIAKQAKSIPYLQV